MATLDELARISVLENLYSTLNSVVNGHTTEIHNLDTRLDTAESKLNNHEERLKTLEVKVEDHERRLQLIENSHIKYTVTVSRKVKYPKKADQGFYLYLPEDLTIDILMEYNLMEYNNGVIKQKWNWLNRIFNPQGFGKVSFDLDRNSEGHIKTTVLGQNTRLLIPTDIHIEEFTPVKSVLKAANEETNSINSGLVYGIEVLGQIPRDEVVVSVFNPTSEIIGIEAGSVLVQVLHLFSYYTVPEKE